MLKNLVRKKRNSNCSKKEKALFIGMGIYYPNLGTQKLVEQFAQQLSLFVERPGYFLQNTFNANSFGSCEKRRCVYAFVKNSIYPLEQFLALNREEKILYLSTIGDWFIDLTEREKRMLTTGSDVSVIANRKFSMKQQKHLLALYGENLVRKSVGQDQVQEIDQISNNEDLLSLRFPVISFSDKQKNRISPIEKQGLFSVKRLKTEDSRCDEGILFKLLKRT